MGGFGLAENVEYVKGPEPDRWHWQKDCKQYPRAVVGNASADRLLTSATNAKNWKDLKCGK